METILNEDDIKGLEDEIESAVDRLFVEKKAESNQKASMESPRAETTFKKTGDQGYPSRPSSTSLPVTKSIEALETALLSLEWEITEENLSNTKEEILSLRTVMEQESGIKSVLDFMESVLSQMIQDGDNIQPSFMKFLLDSKDTIKLLSRKDADHNVDRYKELVYAGIEARFFSLEGLKEVKRKQSPVPLAEGGGRAIDGDRIVREMDLFSEKMDEIFKKMDTYLSRLGPTAAVRPGVVEITIFKVGERLFGVESNRVCKLFKVPESFSDRISGGERIRLKGIELKMVDLKKRFLISAENRTREMRLLTVKDDEEYKGLMVDYVLKSFSTTLDEETGGEPFLGMVRWKYEDRPVDIPILNVSRL